MATFSSGIKANVKTIRTKSNPCPRIPKYAVILLKVLLLSMIIENIIAEASTKKPPINIPTVIVASFDSQAAKRIVFSNSVIAIAYLFDKKIIGYEKLVLISIISPTNENINASVLNIELLVLRI
jgi:hypothetical protein